MKLLGLFVVPLVVALAAGCGAKKKEITEAHRQEAALHVSEAQFALSVRDWARAEPLLAKAAELTPDVPALWRDLGIARRRLNQSGPAKTAYRAALAGFEEAAKNRPTEPQLVVEQVKVLVLLGRVDDARALLDKLPAKFPEDRNVKAFVDSKPIDQMLADPKFKELAL
jgi:Flp pilus assembly protein TadD